MKTLVWLRNDLRTTDNPALSHATIQGDCDVVYLLCPAQWQLHDTAPHRIAFILRSLEDLAENLAALGFPFHIELGSSFKEAPAKILRLAKSIGADRVYANTEIPVDEQRRDSAAELLLESNGVKWQAFDAVCAFSPGTVTKPDNSSYTVYTPFKKRWFSQASHHGVTPLARPKAQGPQLTPSAVPQRVGDVDISLGAELWSAGESAGLKQLSAFLKRQVQHYDAKRDFPALTGTSGLSPHLATGTLSANTCLSAAFKNNQNRWHSGHEGVDVWISELVWREFYHNILAAFPRISKGRAFRIETDQLPWNENQEWLERWQAGETGFPFVDAGMRQLNTTGWMHNRLRMVTSQFLAKHLFLDWREGERYFMSKLVDGDLAANNGGWQWSASTGTDAAPYFRIFNPIRQAERFDPNGDFVRSMVPELSGVEKKRVLEPWRGPAIEGYPEAMIDLSVGRDATLAAWSVLKKR